MSEEAFKIAEALVNHQFGVSVHRLAVALDCFRSDGIREALAIMWRDEGHACHRCRDGEKPCVQGNPETCSWSQVPELLRILAELKLEGVTNEEIITALRALAVP